MLTKYLISLLALGFLLTGSTAFTHDALPTEATAEEAMALDEIVEAHELEINEPSLLPDNPFYFLKNWGREIQAIFTFDPSRKAELRLRFAAEKIIELQKLLEKNATPEKIKKGAENYRKEIEKLAKESQAAGETEPNEPETNKFLDKFIKQQTLHQRILQRMENQVPLSVFEKIRAARQEHLKKFAEVMTKLEEKEKIGERLERIIEELKGSEFKNFKNLEILMDLEEKMPQEALPGIHRAQENFFRKLKEEMEAAPEKFEEYMENVIGSRERKIEVLENLRSDELMKKPQLRENLLETRDKILEKLDERAEKTNCPAWTPPSSGFCKDGRTVVEKSADGCFLPPTCLVPGEFGKQQIFCITLWDPVCGKNGRTYSNECFAKVANIEIDHNGSCQGIKQQQMQP